MGAKTYYQGRRNRYRPVVIVGPFQTTVGQAGATMAGVFASFMVSAPVPWGLATLAAGGLAVGSYFFPKPEGRGKFRLYSEDELEAMTREDVRVHMHQLREREMPIAVPAAVLQKQARAARIAAERTPALIGAAEMSLVDLQVWVEASYRHEEAVRRWSQYELDVDKQIRFPAMTDIRQEPTAAMIRAMRQATVASNGANAQDYARAVEQLAAALGAAETHARAHQVETGN